MKVFAYCCKSFEESVSKAAGVTPHTCPPLTADQFDYKWLEGQDMLYFDLHGIPNDPTWYGDEREVALVAEQIRIADLSGSVVFAVNCYLADEDSPMMDALLEAGAKYVIAAPGENYGGTHSTRWASFLGLALRTMMQLGFDPLRALALAKDALKIDRVASSILNSTDSKEVKAIQDTLEFRAYYRR